VQLAAVLADMANKTAPSSDKQYSSRFEPRWLRKAKSDGMWPRSVPGHWGQKPGKLEAPAPTGHKNQTWDPELRIETLDPDRNWIACFIHDTGSITT
jgi:hypothetical protein